jgi:hypothetical protein
LVNKIKVPNPAKLLTGKDFLSCPDIGQNLRDEWQKLPGVGDDPTTNLSIIFSIGDRQQTMVCLKDDLGNRIRFMPTDKFATISIPKIGSDKLSHIMIH